MCKDKEYKKDKKTNAVNSRTQSILRSERGGEKK